MANDDDQPTRLRSFDLTNVVAPPEEQSDEQSGGPPGGLPDEEPDEHPDVDGGASADVTRTPR